MVKFYTHTNFNKKVRNTTKYYYSQFYAFTFVCHKRFSKKTIQTRRNDKQYQAKN